MDIITAARSAFFGCDKLEKLIFKGTLDKISNCAFASFGTTDYLGNDGQWHKKMHVYQIEPKTIIYNGKNFNSIDSFFNYLGSNIVYDGQIK